MRLEFIVEKIAQRLNIPAEDVQSSAARIQPLPPFAPSAPPEPALRPPLDDLPAVDAEGFFGGRVLLAVGAFTLLLGVGFFIKYAFDNGWIGPTGRVAIGLLAGVGFVALGQRFQRTTGTKIFAGVLTGLGGGILYLSLWGAGNGFHLVPLSVTFLAMGLVTSALILLAVRNDSQLTAALGMLGGFITPLLNSDATPQTLNLFVYLTILDSVLVLLPINRRWASVQISAFVFTQGFVSVAFGTDHGIPLTTYIAFATLYLAIFLAVPLRKARAGIAMSTYEIALAIAATGVYYATLHAELFTEHRHWLTAAVVALAAAFVLFARTALSRDRVVLAGIGLALITGGVAVTFTGNIVAILWAVEGALLIWVGFKQGQFAIRLFGLIGLVLAGLDVMAFPPLAGPHFANERFVTSVIFAGALFAVRAAAVRYAAGTSLAEAQRYTAAEPLGHACILYGFSYELYYLTNANELSLTLFWLGYAAALFAFGFVRRKALARWEAFTLLSLAIIKAFLVDMGALNPGVRIISFLALGIGMLAISYAYQQYAKRAAQAT